MRRMSEISNTDESRNESGGDRRRENGRQDIPANRLLYQDSSNGIEEYGCGYIPRTGVIARASSSSGSNSSSRSTPGEEDPRLLDFNGYRSSSALRLEAAALRERLQLLHIHENIIRNPPVPIDGVTADTRITNGGALYIRNSVLPNSSMMDEREMLSIAYSNGLIGDRRGFSHPTSSMTRIPDVPTVALLPEPHPLYTNNYLRFLNYVESVNVLNDNLQPGFPICSERSNNVAVLPSMGFQMSPEVHGLEDSFIMQGNGLSSNGHNANDYFDRRMLPINTAHMQELRRNQRLRPPPPPHVKITIYNMAKDQDGCLQLQEKIEEKNSDAIHIIFSAVIDRLLDLMENLFGNYLVQKLLDVCSIEQRMMMIFLLTYNSSELIRISLNTHGTRVVQKLIGTFRTRQEIVLVTDALKPGLLKLIKDLNGSHVLQKCLMCLPADDNKFIFDLATKYCIDIGTHKNGCCALQHCLSYSTGAYYRKLMVEISSNSLLLARDCFGNYVIQHILDSDDKDAHALLVSCFKGNFVDLSMQKFSSNVVERFIKILDADLRAEVISELLSKETFEQLLQDPYGNYVILRALEKSKGSPLHGALIQAIRPLGSKLKNNLYCRHIFSKISRNDF